MKALNHVGIPCCINPGSWMLLILELDQDY